MPLITIVETYIGAALRQAIATEQEDGSIAAYIPGFPGVLGFGPDVHRCFKDLWNSLEAWIKVALANGYELPVIEDIDLNTSASGILATYHDGMDRTPPPPMFEDEAELNRAFEEWSASA